MARLPSYFCHAADDYETTLASKVHRIADLFSGVFSGSMPATPSEECIAGLRVYRSPPLHYRVRARFGLRPRPDGDCGDTVSQQSPLCFAMLDKGERFWLDDGFPIATERICELMPQVARLVGANDVLRRGIAGCHFLSTQCSPDEGGGDVITLVYEKLEDGSTVEFGPTWHEAAQGLRMDLGGTDRNIHVVGRASGGRVMKLDTDMVLETFVLADGRRLKYRKTQGVFSNPNPVVCVHSLNWLCGHCDSIRASLASASHRCVRCEETYTSERGLRLMELFCGNGNHTVALAGSCSYMVAVEISGRLVDLCVDNLKLNGFCARRARRDMDWAPPVRTDTCATCCADASARDGAAAPLGGRTIACGGAGAGACAGTATTAADVGEGGGEGGPASSGSSGAVSSSVGGRTDDARGGGVGSGTSAAGAGVSTGTSVATGAGTGAGAGEDEHLRAGSSEMVSTVAPGGTEAGHKSNDVGMEVVVVQCPAERVCRSFSRTRAQRFDVLVVDPPRCGLDRQSLRVASEFERVLYISCNPDALLRDVKSLASSHVLADLVFFDHFPCVLWAPYPKLLLVGSLVRLLMHTACNCMCVVLVFSGTVHSECGAFLVRKRTEKKTTEPK